jgi:hypothetical protein
MQMKTRCRVATATVALLLKRQITIVPKFAASPLILAHLGASMAKKPAIAERAATMQTTMPPTTHRQSRVD